MTENFLSLIEFLNENSLFYKLTTDKKNLIIRCPYCCDSNEHHNKGHFYIKTETPYTSFCHICNKSANMLTLLKDINCSNLFIKDNFKKELKEFYNLYSDEELEYDQNKKKSLLILEPEKYDVEKIRYINKRIGFNIDQDKSYYYKIIYNINNFLYANKLQILNYDKIKKGVNIDKYLDDYVGFLDYYENAIVARNTKDNYNMRWRKLTIRESDNLTFYCLNTDINILTPKVKVIMCEGIFDLMLIKEQLYQNENQDHVYTAVLNRYYNNIINNLIRMKILDFDLHVYADNDYPMYDLLTSLNKNIYVDGVTVYYNTKMKDFGEGKLDKLEKIHLSKNNIKIYLREKKGKK